MSDLLSLKSPGRSLESLCRDMSPGGVGTSATSPPPRLTESRARGTPALERAEPGLTASAGHPAHREASRSAAGVLPVPRIVTARGR